MRIMLVISPEEKERSLFRMQDHLAGHTVKVYSGEVVTAEHLVGMAAQAKLDAIITTREDVLLALLPQDRSAKAKISNYAGSYFTGYRVPILIIPVLHSLLTSKYGNWLMSRLISKVTKPEKWRKTSAFEWTWMKEESHYEQCISLMRSATACAVDIETVRGELPTITSVSYSILLADMSTRTFVMEMDSMQKVYWMRQLNATRTAKIMQNGKYDSAYFFAWGAPLVNYIADTVNAMHAWYAELPKDLAFISALFVRESMYWKDLAASGDKVEQLQYNALDTWATLEAFIAWSQESPDWAKFNYVHEFTQVPICHAMEMRGLKRDMGRMAVHVEKLEVEAIGTLAKIRARTNTPNFNPNSHLQVKTLMRCIGINDPKSSDESALTSAILLHPLNEAVLEPILDYRGQLKLLSTYMPTDSSAILKEKKKGGKVELKAKEFRGQMLWSINPHGTDTGRKAAKEHHFWCGFNVQNIPARAWEVKDTLIAPDEYDIWEFDFSQAEARGVGYCSGDENLLAAVNSPRDFHSVNASAFFGIPYEEIFRDEIPEYWDNEKQVLVPKQKKKQLNVEIRDLSKRTNHGANYNMGEAVMVETMGVANVRKAQALLNLPKHYSLREVTRFLLNRYDATYPKVKGLYYNWIKNQVRTRKMLTGPTGWTRYCFGDPSSNKPDLNMYVAHVTQNLNAMVLDEAVLKLWNKYGKGEMVLFLAQIHDSFLCLIRKGSKQEEIAKDIAAMMTFAVPVTDCTGVTRDMIVPVDAKKAGHRWSGRD